MLRTSFYAIIFLILWALPAAIIAVAIDSIALSYYLPESIQMHPDQVRLLVENAQWFITPVGTWAFFIIWLIPAISIGSMMYPAMKARLAHRPMDDHFAQRL